MEFLLWQQLYKLEWKIATATQVCQVVRDTFLHAPSVYVYIFIILHQYYFFSFLCWTKFIIYIAIMVKVKVLQKKITFLSSGIKQKALTFASSLLFQWTLVKFLYFPSSNFEPWEFASVFPHCYNDCFKEKGNSR